MPREDSEEISTWASAEGPRARFLAQEKGRTFKSIPSSAILGRPHSWYGSSETAKRINALLWVPGFQRLKMSHTVYSRVKMAGHDDLET